ncbi:MAG: PAS domain-containing protein, partial [Candidatus Marinimicrobia bacterium]|nr:PAS domain-containing protein [Candidatus Neomarinimicrobiota bacterium]
IVGKSGATLTATDDQVRYKNYLADCIAGKTVHGQHIRHVTKRGIVRKAQVSLHLLTDAKNESSGVVIVAKHRSDREKSGRALDHVTRNFMEIEDPVIIENMEGEVTAMNTAAVALYGWNKGDLVGKPAKSLIPADQHRQADELMAKCQAGELVKQVESTRWSRSGQFIPVQLTMFQVLNSEELPSEVVSITRPVSQASLGVTGAGPLDYNMIYNSSIDPIIIEDLSGDIIELNDAAEDLLGWKRVDLKGRPLKMTIPADQHKLHDKIILLCQNDVPIKKVESKCWSKEGQVFSVDVSLVLLKDSEGEPFAIINTFQDNTAFKKLQRKKRQLESQMGQA